MSKLIIKNIVIIVLLFSANTLFSQDQQFNLRSVLTPVQEKQLLTHGEIHNLANSLSDLKWWKETPFNTEIASFIGNAATIVAEEILNVELPNNWSKKTSQEKNMFIFKAFTQFKDLKGLEVYASFQKRNQTFIYEAYKIDSLTKNHPEPNPEYMSEYAINPVSFLIYERERQTGAAVFKFDYTEEPGFTRIDITNQTELSYLYLPTIWPNRVKQTYYIFPKENGLEILSLTSAKITFLFGLENLFSDTFYYRMKSMNEWFVKNLNYLIKNTD